MPTPLPMGFCQPEWNDEESDPSQILFNVCFKRKFRWKLTIPSICADGVSSLPPSKSSRPSISFKEINVEHLNEIIYFPGKPEWKLLNLTLYDIVKDEDDDLIENPVFTWIRRQYDPKPKYTSNVYQGCSYWKPCLEGTSPFKVPVISLILVDGCGTTQEGWAFESVYPQNVEFGELDYNDSSIVMVDLSLRYDRAYITTPDLPATLSFTSLTVDCSIPSEIAMSVPEPEFRMSRF